MPKDEASEVAELLDLFGHSTDVPRGMLLKFQVSRENRVKADRERQAKEDRQKLLEERHMEQQQRIERLRAKRGDLDREAVAKLHADNRKNAKRVKAEVQQWEQLRQIKQQQLVKKVRDKGSADFHNARVGEIEEKMLKDRRDKAQREHADFLRKERARNQAKAAALSQQAGRMRAEVDAANASANEKLTRMKTTLAGEAREAKREWKEQFERNEKERMDRAHANRKHAEDVRARAKANLEAQKNRRQNVGTAMAKKNANAINATRSADLDRKRQLRKNQYKKRFASTTEAAALQKSTFRRLYGLNGILNEEAASALGGSDDEGSVQGGSPLQAQTEPLPGKSGAWGW